MGWRSKRTDEGGRWVLVFEGAVMATVQEMGGDYGIQRFVGNFGAIVFAPLGGYVIDSIGYEAAIYIYLVLKLIAALLILLIKLDFKPPGMQNNFRKDNYVT